VSVRAEGDTTGAYENSFSFLLLLPLVLHAPVFAIHCAPGVVLTTPDINSVNRTALRAPDEVPGGIWRCGAIAERGLGAPALSQLSRSEHR
jgi:hypothetical protein